MNFFKIFHLFFDILNGNALRAALMGLSAFRDLHGKLHMIRAKSLLQALCRGDGEGALDNYTALFYNLRKDGLCTYADVAASNNLEEYID